MQIHIQLNFKIHYPCNDGLQSYLVFNEGRDGLNKRYEKTKTTIWNMLFS